MRLERANLEEKDKLKNQIDEILPYYLENKFNRLVNGSLCDLDILKLKSYFPYTDKVLVVITELNNYEILHLRYNTEEADEIKFDMVCRLKEVLSLLGISYSFFMNERDDFLVSIINVNDESRIMSEDTLKCFQNFIKNSKTGYGLEITIAVGETCKDIFSGISDSFRHAKQNLEYKFYFGYGRVFLPKDAARNPENCLYYSSSREDELANAIKRDDREGVASIINSIIDGMLADGFPLPQLFIETMVYLVLNLARTVEGFVERESYSQLIMNIKRELEGCGCIEELRRKCIEYALHICDIYANLRNNKDQLVIYKCLQYMEENYMEDLSLENTANKFHFNASYFSNYFKNHTGFNFSDLLLNIRIKKACKLLEETGEKVSDVALSVGYKNVRYFNAVFKKELNMTPQEYRRMIQKTSDEIIQKKL